MFASSAQNAFACVCSVVEGESIEMTSEKAFNRSSKVFEGKIVGFEFKRGLPASESVSKDPAFNDPDKFETMVVKFEMGRIWKGRDTKFVFATYQLKSDSGISMSSSCDFNFEVGEKYLVFANETKGVLRIGFCAGTRKLTGSAEDKAILKYFGTFCLPDDPA